MDYAVCIQERDGHYTATAPLLPNCRGEGETRDQALGELRARVFEVAEHTESTVLEGPSAKGTRRAENPWLETAGMFEDDALYQEMLKNVEAYRRELDRGTE